MPAVSSAVNRRTGDDHGRDYTSAERERRWAGWLQALLWSTVGVMIGIALAQVTGWMALAPEERALASIGQLQRFLVLLLVFVAMLGTGALVVGRREAMLTPAPSAPRNPRERVSPRPSRLGRRPVTPPPVEDPDQDQQRRYKLISILGKGGFGTVYRARLLMGGGFSKSVALKVLRGDGQQVRDLARRLADEARLLALVQHRAIVRVDELVSLSGRLTIVMECVDGRDLNAILERCPVPVGPALEIAAEVASALHTAYSTCAPDGRPLRLVHRDIKPANICLTAQGEVKLLDFGIASADLRGRENTTMGQTFGTPEYMAPERFGYTSGPEADIYALGATLYELLSGLQFGRACLDSAEHGSAVEHRLWRLWRRLGDDEAPIIQLVSEMLRYRAEQRPTARDVERRLLRAARLYVGPTLHDWAEEVIPRLIVNQPIQEDELAGPTQYVMPDAASPRLVATDEVSASNWPRPVLNDR